MLVAGIKEDLLCAEVIRRCIKPDDEVARKQILLQGLVVRIGVDENVGERRCSITDVATAMEQ